MGFHMLPALFEIIMAGSMFGYLPGSYASVLSDAGWDSSSILIRPPCVFNVVDHFAIVVYKSRGFATKKVQENFATRLSSLPF
jgi:hypothetical protein